MSADQTTADYECENCIGMAAHGCYCKAVRVLCEACGGEGRRYTSRYGGNDPDVWDAGPCQACEGTCYVDVEAAPVTLEDMQNV